MFAQARLIGLCIVGFAFAALALAWQIEKRSHAKAKARIVELVELRKSDRASYEAAQREAATNNKADVAKIEARQERITNEATSSYRRELADLRLRAQTRANRGSPNQPGLPGVPKAPGGTDGDGVPDAPCDDLCASEIELRLKHLQDWVSEQGGVSTAPR